jgi:glyoxylase I family protein
MVKNLLHVALCVSNLSRARHFYADILGLQEIVRPDIFGSKGIWFDVGVGAQLHITQTDRAESPAPAALGGIRNHVAFRIESYESAIAALRSAGVECQGGRFGCKQIFASDYDGNVIELQEVDARGLPQRLTTPNE